MDCKILSLTMQKGYLMPFIPKFIKPCRKQDKSPVLTKSKSLRNAKKAIETCLILDLNILSKMNEVISGDIKYLDSGLQDFVTFLNKTPNIYLTAGLATIEVDHKWLVNLVESYEKFLSIYAKSYVDTPNATRNFLNDSPKEKNKFRDLPENEQYLNSVAYVGILKIWIIQRTQNILQDIEKYKLYIEYMENTVDMIGGIETEVAKYVFFDGNNIKDVKFKSFWKDIYDNFYKRKNSTNLENILKDCLNAARDIMYYRLTALMSDKLLDNKKQDTWLVTADNGLANLTNSIYFVSGMDDSDAKYINIVRNDEQKESFYWKYCDELTQKKITQRSIFSKFENTKTYDLKNIVQHINSLEKEIELLCKN